MSRVVEVGLTSVVEGLGFAIVGLALLQMVVFLFGQMKRNRAAAQRDEQETLFFREWSEAQLQAAQAERDRNQLSWSGKRKFRIEQKHFEDPNKTICSFALVPHDGKPVAPFRPGQFLTFIVRIQGKGVFIRCYSLSSTPHQTDHYRISIKRLMPPPDAPENAPPGTVSSYFHDHLNEGDIVDVTAPAGEFHLDEESTRPLVLIAGGIGITPLISILDSLAESGSSRDVWLFYGVRNHLEHPFLEHLSSLKTTHPNVRVIQVYSRPTENCRKGFHYDHEGHIGMELLQSELPSGNFEFYLCGPPAMMGDLVQGLRDWGVPEDDIRYEAFGRETVGTLMTRTTKTDETHEVLFQRSDQTLTWSPDSGTLLDLGEEAEIKLSSGCRAGNCGTCLATVREGEVEYLARPSQEPTPGTCLLCICRPKTRLVLDA